MCHYCGCRETPLIRDYIAEHERAINLGGDAVRAIDDGELAKAAELLGAMAVELRSHWQGEEKGLFAVMGRDELFAEHIDPLVREHRDLEALLGAVDLSDPTDQGRVRDAVFELHEHIAKEEDGLFPASLTTLSGDEWEASMQAWRAAHPGGTMIGE
ncbi:hemerythrin domain-containing protein [Actinoplanes sp. CA-252034]|uniref:hemerythrin domain-containing protein n=1 Tax=Actinoplanes sp. CA-252034 TaxID=3239906 RepID=UPI003D9836AE